MYYDKQVELYTLNGKTIKSITGLQIDSEEVRVFTVCGGEYLFYHEQDCCEDVALNDFEGDAQDLIGALILSAEEVKGTIPIRTTGYQEESTSWTFYKVETSKGGLWMRWLGESNGYYSESVEFAWVNKPDEEK